MWELINLILVVVGVYILGVVYETRKDLPEKRSTLAIIITALIMVSSGFSSELYKWYLT